MDSIQKKEPGKTFKDDAEGPNSVVAPDDDPPYKKPRLELQNEEKPHQSNTIQMNENLLTKEFINMFRNKWENETSFVDSETGVDFSCEPFKLSILSKFLEDTTIIQNLVDEISNVKWSRKKMDLYEFYQTTDLSNISAPTLQEFYRVLQENVMPWVEEITNIKLDNVSASCSMYTAGDYLLVHDDLLNNRQVAFVFYISPWPTTNVWTEEMGGCLEILGTDSNELPCYPILKKVPPKNNQFVFFKVGQKSFHQVGEVTQLNYPRLTINGWFHGAQNDDLHLSESRNIVNRFMVPSSYDLDLGSWFNDIYLTSKSKRKIQNQIEDCSEICLHDFLKPNKLKNILDELQNNNDLIWTIKGPANCMKYEVLDQSMLPDGIIQNFINLFGSKEIFQLLFEYTELDLAGKGKKNPTFYMELQKWRHGCYTVLGDNLTYSEDTLDLTLYINASDSVGVITYLDPEEEDTSVLLNVLPKNNALNLVYRLKGTLKFTKYVSKRTVMPFENIFILSCSYKE